MPRFTHPCLPYFQWCLGRLARRELLCLLQASSSLAQQRACRRSLPGSAHSVSFRGERSRFAASLLWTHSLPQLSGRTGHRKVDLTSQPKYDVACYQPWAGALLDPWWLWHIIKTSQTSSRIASMHFYLLLMLSELLNAAAMTGSSSTIKFCFSAMWSFLFLMHSVTQF